jgi:hypothetical protein
MTEPGASDSIFKQPRQFGTFVATPLRKRLSSSGLTGRSSTPQPLDSITGVSGILGRPVKPGDDGWMRRVRIHDKPSRSRSAMRPSRGKDHAACHREALLRKSEQQKTALAEAVTRAVMIR